MLLTLQPLLDNGWFYNGTAYTRTASQSIADLVSATVASDTFNRDTLNPASDGGTWLQTVAGPDGTWSCSSTGTYAGMLTFTGIWGGALLRNLGAGVQDWSFTAYKGSVSGAVIIEWASDATNANYYRVAVFGTSGTTNLTRVTGANVDLASFTMPGIAAGGTTFRIRFDPSSGVISIWVDGSLIGTWTDPTPLTGTYVGLYQNPFAGIFAAYDNFSAVRSVSMLDTAARGASVSRGAADGLAVPGQLDARSVATARTATDSTSTTDSAVRSTSQARIGTDSVTVTTGAARTVSFVRTSIDSLGCADAALRSTSTTRTAADTVATSDATGRSIAVIRRVADSLNLTASAGRGSTQLRTATQSMPSTSGGGGGSDDFNRTSLNPASDGGTWVQTVANQAFTCDGARLRPSATNTGTCVRDVGAGVQDFTITQFRGDNTGYSAVVWAADTAASGTYYGIVTDGSLLYVYLHRFVAGTSTQLGDSFTFPTYNNGSVLWRVRYDPSTGESRIYANGVLRATIVDPVPLTGTNVGVRESGTPSASSSWDDFTAVGTGVASGGDSASRAMILPRTAADAVVAAESTGRVLILARPATDATTMTDAAQSQATQNRTATDAIRAMPDGAALALVTVRTAKDSMIPADWPLLDPAKSIAGVVRNADGSLYLGGATVQLIRDSDGLCCATVTSSGTDGSYGFARDTRDPYTYTVRAFTGDPKEDITRSGLVPA